MRTSFDTDLRHLERAFRADPSDTELGQRYAAALRRSGETEQALSVLFRLGERVESCAQLGIRWEADRPQTNTGEHPMPLFWKGEALSEAEVLALAAPDLQRFDPTRLAAYWPRRKSDGAFRMSTTQFLARYDAHEEGAPYRRLWLLAWTPSTDSLRARPDDRGKPILTVSLETRSTRKTKLLPEHWQREG